MKKAKQTKAARFCAASRIVGYGGVLACAVAAAAWYILTVPVGGKSLDDLDKVAGLLPLPLLIAAGAAVLFILAAIVLRIVAHHYEKKMFANAARRKFEKLRKEVSKHAKTGVRKAKEVGKDLSGKISAAAEQAKKSYRENAKICKAERRAARREDKRLRKAIAKREQAEARLALKREKDAEKAARKAVRKGIRQPEPVPAVKFNRTMLCPPERHPQGQTRDLRGGHRHGDGSLHGDRTRQSGREQCPPPHPGERTDCQGSERFDLRTRQTVCPCASGPEYRSSHLGPRLSAGRRGRILRPFRPLRAERAQGGLLRGDSATVVCDGSEMTGTRSLPGSPRAAG